MKKKELLEKIEKLEALVENQATAISELSARLLTLEKTHISQWQYDNLIKKTDAIGSDYKSLWGELISKKILEDRG